MNPISSANTAGLMPHVAPQLGPQSAAAAGQGNFAALLRQSGSAAEGSAMPGAAQQAQAADDGELKEQFTAFVGQTLFGQLFKAMRSSLGKPAYFHGGRTEEIFQQQLDQVLSERMTDAQGGRYAEAMYDLQFGDNRGANFSASL